MHNWDDIEKIRCKDCGNEFEAHYHMLVNGSEILEESCPQCRKKKLNIEVEKLKEEKSTANINRLKEKMAVEYIDCVCVDCGESFKGLWVKLLSKPIRCKSCVIKKEEKEKLQEEQQREIELKEKKNKWLNSCGIPLRYKNNSFIDYKVIKENKTAFNACVEFSENYTVGQPFKSLGLFSKYIYGNGKSHLIYSVAKRVIERHYQKSIPCPIHCITEYNLFSKIRATFNSNSTDTEDSILKHLTNIPLLIVDDIGKEDVGDFKFLRRIWFAIIDGRYNNTKPIVFSSNLDDDGLVEWFGGKTGNEATIERLFQMMGNKYYEITDKSHRGIQK